MSNSPAKASTPVFKTPMSYHPRPSVASKEELLRRQLGLEDAAQAEEDQSTDDEGEIDHASGIEYRVLKRAMVMREAQHDELVLKVCSLTDKNRSYRARLAKEEATRRQQLKILKKAHEVTVSDKEALVEHLQAIVMELDERISDIEKCSKISGERTSGGIGVAVARLTEQVRHLHGEKFELVGQLLSAQTTAESLQSEMERLRSIVNENRQLVEQTHSAQLAVESVRADSEKMLQRLEEENAMLKRNTNDLQRRLGAVAAAPHDAVDKLRRLEEQNGKLMNRLLSLEADCATSVKKLSDSEQRHREELHSLTEERRKAELERRTLEREVGAARSKPPEVIERRVEVPVESEELKTTLAQLRLESANQLAELISYKKLHGDANAQLRENMARLSALETSLQSRQDEIASQRQTTGHTVSELTQSRDAAAAELLSYKKLYDDASSQLREANSKLCDRENLLKSQKDDLAQLRQTLSRTVADLERSRDAAVSESRSHKKLLADSSDQLQQTQHRLSQLEMRIKDCNDELASQRMTSNRAIAELERGRDACSGELKTYKTRYSDAVGQLEIAKEKSAQLETQLKIRDQDLKVLQQSSGFELTELQRGRDAVIAQLQLDADRSVRQASANRESIQSQLLLLAPSTRALAQDFAAVKQLCCALARLAKESASALTRDVAAAVERVSEHNRDLVRKYRKEMQLRKKYHNELVELKGNIRVFCRIRPAIKEDGEGISATNVIERDRDDDDVIHVSYKGRQQIFDMDKIFDCGSTQEQVFEEVKALATSCVDGYNVCIFAYGQTGSGKTFTMEGPVRDPGINQRALALLFSETLDRKREWDFSIRMSAMEIYNESLRDLLSGDPGALKLDIKMAQDSSLYVPGLTWIDVCSLEDVNRAFAHARVNRATATTNMNEHSSRSHAVLCVEVAGVNRTTGAKSAGKLNLVDLAGSERVSKSGADGDRLKEAQKINKSLSSLGDVISALRSKQSFVPYRNSKLTYLLQDSLGGDSKTLMIVQVSPVQYNVSETMCSLAFAQRVRAVELGAASKCLEAGESNGSRERLDQSDNGQPSTPSKVPALGRRK